MTTLPLRIIIKGVEQTDLKGRHFALNANKCRNLPKEKFEHLRMPRQIGRFATYPDADNSGAEINLITDPSTVRVVDIKYKSH